MYKVLIVDDEALVRIGLKTTIDWEELGFTIISEAANGEEAFKLYQKYNPEIVITDIRMPKEDGFYLIEKIRNQNKKSKILVLTVYDDFSYVRKALKLGADDYILKTEIEDKELIELMLRLKDDLKKEDSKEKTFNQKNEILLQKTLFNQIIRNDFNLNDKILTDFKKIGFDIKNNNFIIANILTTSEKKNSTNKNLNKINNALINIIFEKFSAKDINYIYNEYQNNYVFLLGFNNLDEKKLKKIFKNISRSAEQYFDIKIKIIYSNLFNDSDKMYSNYKKIIEKNEINFYKKENENFVKHINQISFKNTNIFNLKNKYNKEIIESLITNDLGEIKKIIAEANSYFDHNNIVPMEVKLFYSNLLTEIFNSFNNTLQTENYSEEYKNYYYSILNDSYIKNIEEHFLDFIKTILTKLKSSNYSYSKILVDRALNYINNNYSQKISLEDIADEVNISKNYLCNIFKEETGENTSSYINEVRIEKAKKLLLEKNYKLKEIYNKVGFSNQYYFSKVFKKISGMTVTEYKKIINNE